MSFWARYVLLKQGQGQDRKVTLQQIENKFGLAEREKIEQELAEQ